MAKLVGINIFRTGLSGVLTSSFTIPGCIFRPFLSRTG